jgi:transposase
MLYAGIDIHKRVFQAVVLDPDSGELSECRFEPSRERLNDWAMEWQGKVAAVAIEATTGWRWVVRELQAHGFEVHLVDPGRASALRGRRSLRVFLCIGGWLGVVGDAVSEVDA